MASGRGKILKGERPRSNLQVENLVLESSKAISSMVTVWKAECVGAEAHGCVSMV